MAVQRAVAERWQSTTGKPLIEAYGLTETSPAAIANPLNIDRYQRRDRPADALDRHRHSRRRRPRPQGRRSRRIVHQGPAGHGGLLEPARRDRQGDDRRRLLADRRHRPGRRTRLRVHRRSQEGHDQRLGLQRLSERNRGRGDGPSGRARGGRGRRARRQDRGGGQARGRAQGHGPDRSRSRRLLPPASDRATRRRGRSSSAMRCRRRLSARSCAANCGARTRRPGDERPPRKACARPPILPKGKGSGPRSRWPVDPRSFGFRGSHDFSGLGPP